MRAESARQMAAHDEQDAVPVARWLLTGERISTAFVLLAFGVGGILQAMGAGLGAALIHAGFAYPVLKGLGVLLETYVNRTRARAPAAPKTLRATPLGFPDLGRHTTRATDAERARTPMGARNRRLADHGSSVCRPALRRLGCRAAHESFARSAGACA